MVKPLLLEKVKLYIRKHKKVTIGIILILAIMVFALVHFRTGEDKKSAMLTQKVNFGDIKQTVSCTGLVQSVRSVNVAFRNSGLVNKVMVSEGDKVTTGQVMATQNTKDYQIKKTQAEGALESAQANLSKVQQGNRIESINQAKAGLSEAEINLSQAKNNLSREKQLYNAEAESKATYEQTQTDYKVAEQKYLSAKAQYEEQVNGNLPQDIADAQGKVKTSAAQLQSAQIDLDGTKITVPFDGYVSLINGETGQWTTGGAPPSGTDSSMFYITVVSKELELSCQVNEADIGSLKIGQSATFTVDAYPDRTLKATVKSIAPQATTVSNVQMYNVIFSIPQNDILKAGMPVNVSITTGTRSHVLKIPLTALNDEDQVLVLKNGVTKKVRVTTGLKDDASVEITKGLQAGDQVVVGSSSQNESSQTNQKTQQNSGGHGGGMGGAPPMGP